eukprot:GCRY01001024.1.p1 GENE.GCRY01001024.1~~GCRY01001024.1.p1  ORF type:complete len:297 (+),score=50.37 GCRY01001024.1:192-1082(+)
MASDFLVTVVGFAATACCFWLYLSSLVDIRKMQQTKSNMGFSIYPLLFLLFNGLSWTVYASFVPDFFVFVVNFVGFGIQIYFCSVVYSFTEKQLPVNIIYCVSWLVILVIWSLCVFTFSDSTAETVSGSISIMFFCLSQISPLSQLGAAIKTQTTAGMSFSLSIATFANCGLWVVYGLFKTDFFILGPNLFGTLSSIVRLTIFLLFGGRKAPSPSKAMTPLAQCTDSVNGSEDEVDVGSGAVASPLQKEIEATSSHAVTVVVDDPISLDSGTQTLSHRKEEGIASLSAVDAASPEE